MEHIDVLPRIIEPSMMANVIPSKETNVSGSSKIIKNKDESIPTTMEEKKESFLQSKFVLLKQNFVMILIIISIMVVIYVVYKFYFYRKNESKLSTIQHPHASMTQPLLPKTNPFTKIEELQQHTEQPVVEYTQSAPTTHSIVQDANKYTSLDQYHTDEEEEAAVEAEEMDVEEASSPPKETSTYDFSSKFEHMNIYDGDESEEEKSTAATNNTEIDSHEPTPILQEQFSEETHELPPITVSSSQMDRDIHTILNDIKQDDLSNPFMLNTFIPSKEETESVVSHHSVQSGFSENRNEKIEELPSETEEEKKRPKKVIKRSTRVLKIRNKD